MAVLSIDNGKQEQRAKRMAKHASRRNESCDERSKPSGKGEKKALFRFQLSITALSPASSKQRERETKKKGGQTRR